MAQEQEIREAIDTMAGRPGPMLSAYLSVNADIPENQGRAYLVRLRDAMNYQEVPEELQKRVREYLARGRSSSSLRRTTFSRSTGCRWTYPSRSGGGTLTWLLSC